MTNRREKTWFWAVAGVGAARAARAAIRRRRALDLAGKTVIVTGGSRGLGLVLARQLVAQQARVAICARNAEELQRARADLVRRGGTVLARPCDVADPARVEEFVRDVRRHLGPVDVLINNAGVIQVGPAEVMTLDDYDEAMKINFWGPVFMTLAVLPDMRLRRTGRVVNISSIGGKISVPHLLPYSASKFALTGFSEGLRAELARYGIRVTTVIPHLMRTGSPPNATFKGRHRDEYTWFSLSDALPIVSMSADRAARRIIRACRQGDAEIVLTLQAKVAIAVHGLFPGATADLLGLVNRILPGPGGIGAEHRLGRESTSFLAPSLLTATTQAAARRNNEEGDNP